jgi:hypothetical protein
MNSGAAPLPALPYPGHRRRDDDHDYDDTDYDDTDHDADEHADHVANALPIMMMMNIPLHMLTAWEGDARAE